jgi:uncharacterized protein YlxW (UPF0749 family)
MEDSLALKIIMGLLAMLTAVLAFNVKSYKNDHDDLKDSHNKLALRVSDEYAKKTDLNAARGEMTDSVKRVHERIDEVGQNVDHKMNTIIGMLRK